VNRIAFALLVSLGCLAGAYAGQFLCPPLVSASAAEVGFSSEITQALEQAGASGGDVQVVLLTDPTDGLMLSCTEPSGNILDRDNPRSASGGVFDIPGKEISPEAETSRKQLASLHWPAGTASEGRYKVLVGRSAGQSSAEPALYVCAVKTGSSVTEFAGSVSGKGRPTEVYEFVYARSSGDSLLNFPLARAALWNGLLALGIALAVCLGQGRLLHQPITLRGCALLLVGLFVAGMAVGTMVEWLWKVGERAELLRQFGPVAGWLVLGGIIGLTWTAVRRTPSKRLHLVLCAAAAGLVAGLALYAARLILPGEPARLVGAICLGAFVGLALTIDAPGVASPLVTPGPYGAGLAQTAFSLRLASGRQVRLCEQQRLTRADLDGRPGSWFSRTVARVARKPDNPGVLGLMNLCRQAWSVTLADGTVVRIEPGRSVRLAAGVRIDFGSVTAEVV
jgi:hypothetical protein